MTRRRRRPQQEKLAFILVCFDIILLLLQFHTSKGTFLHQHHYHHGTTRQQQQQRIVVVPTTGNSNSNGNSGGSRRRTASTTTTTNIKRCRVFLPGITTCSFAAKRESQQPEQEETPDVLSWLESRLQVNSTCVELMLSLHPRLLGYDIQTNLEPTISFYQQALGGDLTATSQLLCDAPSLLEYNVRKRLWPRFNQTREILLLAARLEEEEDHPLSLDVESVRAIATKTDSRFEEWLLSLQQHKDSGGDSSSPTTSSTNHHKNNNLQYSNHKDAFVDEDDDERNPPCYVVLSNLQSGNNIGNILRSASIFGVKECLVVGQKRYRLTGDHLSRNHLSRRHFFTHQDAKQYLLNAHQGNIRIYGIEITPDASPLMRYNPQTRQIQFAFDHDNQREGGEGAATAAAFVMGNEGEGLSVKQREICDEFIFIPQTRGATTTTTTTSQGSSSSSSSSSSSKKKKAGSASLNVACAATVVLQAYATWACYPDATIVGEKFIMSSK